MPRLQPRGVASDPPTAALSLGSAAAAAIIFAVILDFVKIPVFHRVIHETRPIRSAIFPSTCPAASRSCAWRQPRAPKAAAIGTSSLAASTARLSR